MNQKPIILVTGATGAQGGSVAHALLHNNQFTVRILTRNPRAVKAKALQYAGAEVVQGDFNDLKSLQQAISGCYGVFSAIPFPGRTAQERQQGKNLMDTVQRSGIQHFVISALNDYHTGYSAEQGDQNDSLRAYAKSLNLPATFVRAAFFYEDFVHLFPLEKDIDAYYAFGSPPVSAKLAMMSVADLGAAAISIFEHPAAYIGRVVGLVGEDRSWSEYAAIARKVLGRELHKNKARTDGFRIARMLEMQRLHIPNQLVHLIESYALNPNMQSFENWLIKNRDNIEVVATEMLQLQRA